MGNHVSCVCVYSKVQVPSNTVKLIPLDRDVQEFRRAMKAGVLMLDNPQHFVCHSDALQARCHISPLSADDELELGRLYFLIPMDKLHSLSPSEMAYLAFKADSALQKSTSNSRSLVRILPVFGDLCMFPADRKVTTSGGDELNEAKVETTETEHIVMPKLQVYADDIEEAREISVRIMRHKYWKPGLATITESEFSYRSDSSR